MGYLCQKCQKMAVADFVSEITRVKKYSDVQDR